MSHKEFQRLNNNEKLECLWNRGTPVAFCDKDNQRFILYHIEAFYAEAEYKTDFFEVVALRSFEATDIPEMYLAGLSISGLKH